MAKFTVAICTHNRADRLRQALSSLQAAALPSRYEWEVLVVLNDCTDGSADVVRSFLDRLPVVAVTESRRGLSHARNRAVELCHGDFIIFVDDDVRVDAGFLVAYENAFEMWPEDDVFSGPIVPVLEGDPPDWLKRALPVVGSAYARQVVVRDGSAIDPAAPPFGANYAIRSSVQSGRRYDPGLGRGDVGWLRGGEETELLAAVLASGSGGRWAASASVTHIIESKRQTLDYLQRYYEGYGTLVGMTKRIQRGGPPSALGSLAEMAVAELVYRAERLFAPPERWATAMVRAAVRRGKWKSRRLV